MSTVSTASQAGTGTGTVGTATDATGRAVPTPDTVRWLTADEQVLWRAYRDGTVRLLDTLARELEEQTGLSIHEYEVLVRLSEAPDRTLRMSGLADDVAHSRSRLTHTIRRMEERGFVERRPCLDDARGVNCTMTERGWQTLVAAAPSHVQSVRDHLVDVLSPEQLVALGTALAAVREHLLEVGKGGGCHVE